MNHSSFFSHTPVVYFEADKGGGASSDSDNGDPNQSQADAIAAAVKKSVKEILDAKGGDKDSALELAVRKAHRLEVDRDSLKVQLATAQSSQLSEADRTDLAAYRELGKPDEVKTGLTERDTLKGDKAKADCAAERDKAVRAAGLDPAKFANLSGVDALLYETRKEKDASGKDAEVGYARVDDKAEWEPLTKVAAAQWPALVNDLKATPNGHKGAEVPLGYAGRMPAATPKEKTFEERKAEKLAASEYPTL